MTSGTVFNIQNYCIHDGPGIRTTVFLKGCPMRCWWCHNPESQAGEPVVVGAASRCIRCGGCTEACSHSTGDGEPLPVAPRDECTRCGNCVAVCPTESRQMIGRSMTVDELMAEILKDRIFFEDSGGGVTFSGGEPLMQPEFLRETLEACRDEGIHTALDTCGFAPREVLMSVAPLVDLFLYDLKMVDDELHTRFTGVSNATILDNLKHLGREHGRIWLRVPVIPGLNDTLDEQEAIAQVAASTRGVWQLNLLPYHELGSHKPSGGNGAADRPRPEPPTQRQMEKMADRYRALGIETYIGG